MKNILIIGGNKGIGLALSTLYFKTNQYQVIITSREFSKALTKEGHLWKINCDILSDDSILNCVNEINQNFTVIDAIINCAGVLHNDGYLPEKSLKQVNRQQLLENFQTNAVGHLLLLKHFESLIAKAQVPIVCSLSARIASISDNYLGGWYAYRMSKAALNMGFKTLAIEYKRKFPHIKMMLIHPGTTDTELSKPFQKRINKDKLHTTNKTAQLIIKQINKKLNGELDALFVDFDGLAVQW